MEVAADIAFLFDGALHNSTGFIFVVLGILISIRFTGFPDLTVDGSFTFGAALYAVGIQFHQPIVLCLAGAWIGGALGGVMTASVNRVCGIGQIISSVLVMLFLITIVPYITGGSTVGLLEKHHWLAGVQNWDLRLTRWIWPEANFSLHPGFIAVAILVATAAVLGTLWFFRTRLGVQVRYLGSATAPSLLSASRQNALVYLGLAIGNGMIGLGGAIEAERKGGFSQNMGLGVILIGLACLVLGESVIKTFVRRDHLHVNEYMFSVVLGVFGYSLVLQFLLFVGLTFLDVRLTTTLFLLFLLAIAARRHPSTGRLF